MIWQVAKIISPIFIFTGQPESIKEKCRKNPHFRNAGLLARFFWVIPESKVGYRKTGSGHVIENRDVDEYYGKAIRNLAEKMQEALEPRVLYLDPEARRRFEAWEAEIETLLRERGRLGIDTALAEWGGKLAGGTLRLAGILHCADRIDIIADDFSAFGGEERIDGATIDRAINIAYHLIAHAEIFFCGVLEGSSEKSDAHLLAKWIVRTRSERFTKSHAQQQNRTRFRHIDEIDLPLAELIRHNCIRPITCELHHAAGRPASQDFEVNPAMFEAADAAEMGIVDAA